MNIIPGPWELVIILIIVAMLFGVGRLPEVFGAVGKGIREFRKESTVAEKNAEKNVTDTTVDHTPVEN